MMKEYDQITAFHYAAFRPSLHSQILNDCLKKTEYSLGLDIGCGTGHSAIALTNYCKNVIGIEPSEEMLEQAIEHPQVKYIHQDSNSFNFPENHFDIITFAGSLFYAKSQELLDGIVSVSKAHSTMVIYDFEILLDVLFKPLNLNAASKSKSNYNHQVNFDGLNQKGIQVENVMHKSLSLEISINNISHLLLSSKDNYGLLFKALGADNLYHKTAQKLYSVFKSESIIVKTKTYSTIYQVIK